MFTKNGQGYPLVKRQRARFCFYAGRARRREKSKRGYRDGHATESSIRSTRRAAPYRCARHRRRKIFRDDSDRDDLLERLSAILGESRTPCYAWALMPNHFHLLLKTGQTPISTLMRRLLTGYAVSFNLRHRRSGHLFQNRYKSILCREDACLLELVRYIHVKRQAARGLNGAAG